jgi:hypothetical protein
MQEVGQTYPSEQIKKFTNEFVAKLESLPMAEKIFNTRPIFF